ncbi:MAG: HAMP domain-containing protein, partial [Gammaproteobacteria bacterium]|nr:HAMP domain-containing protein [Gammaproteobacteria bacterium]
MRLSIRWKLILSIVVPLLLIAAVVMWFTFERINRFAMDRMQGFVTEQARYHAARLNDRFARVEQIAQGTAAVLEALPSADADLVFRLLEENVEQDPLIFGAAAVFEQFSYGDREGRVALYVHRDGEELVKTDFDHGKGNGTDGKRPYGVSVDRVRKMAHWSDPYPSEMAGNALINSYAVPFFRDGNFSGMATVDVSLNDLADRIDFGNDDDYPFIIVNNNGQFISHPKPEMIWKGSVTGNAEELANPVLTGFARKLISGHTGVVKVSEPELFESDEVFWIYYAPIKTTGWALAMAVPEGHILGFLNSQIHRGIIGLAIMIGLVIVCVLIISTSFTRPLRILNDGVKRLAGGDLNLEIKDVNSSDEIGELARGFNSMVAQLRRHVHALTRETAARESYETEMQFANQVQASLLPTEEHAFPELQQFELFGINRPARHVAGDFFDFFMLENKRLILVIADVSGKGMASALLMAVTRTIIRNQA